MENTNTLNKVNNLEDLDFGEPIIVDKLEQNVSPKIDDIDENKNNDDPVIVPPKTLDELEFDITPTEEPKSEDKDQKVESVKIDHLDAVRAVISNKMAKFNMTAEGVDITELNEEELAEFNDSLDDYILEEKWKNVKGQNKNVEKLLTFLENKGNPEELISLFKEQQNLSKIDITTEEGQVKMLSAYYTEVLKLDPSKINNRIEKLSTSGLLAEEAADIEETYNSYIENKQTEIIEKQQAKAQLIAQQEQRRQLAFEEHLDKAEIPANKKNELRSLAFGTGRIKGSDEDIKLVDYQILKLQSNPETYIKFLQFIADPNSYDESVRQIKKNEKVTTEMKKGFSIPQKTNPGTVVNTQTSKKPLFTFNN